MSERVEVVANIIYFRRKIDHRNTYTTLRPLNEACTLAPASRCGAGAFSLPVARHAEGISRM